MSKDEAYAAFKEIRYAETGGEPVCPKCGCISAYEISTRRIFECKACLAQFSVTSGSIFASRKLPIRDILAAVAIFVNGAKGYANEMAWRENSRCVSNGEQYLAMVGAAMAHPVSRQWKGYWQRVAVAG